MQSDFVRLVVAAVSVTALLLAAGTGRAQEYPIKPITILVPNAAGGSSEILGRILAPFAPSP